MRSKLLSGTPIPPDQISPRGPASPSRQLIQARGVATRYGVHLGTLWRWIDKGILPPPDQIINDRRYWYLDSLEAAERRRTVESAGRTRIAPPATAAE
jgi:hypothetical protein